MKVRQYVSMAAIACASLGLTGQASAADRYGVACVKNLTNQAINYQIKIAKGGWTSYSISPSGSRWFAHRYDKVNEGRSDKLYIRFDSDLRRGKNFTTEYQLKRNKSPEESCASAAIYVFRYEGSGQNYVDLKRQN